MKHEGTVEPADLVDTDVEVACHQLGKFGRWDVHHDEELLTMLAEGASHREIAAALNRTMKQVSNRACYLGLGHKPSLLKPKEPPKPFGLWFHCDPGQPNRAQLHEASIWHLVDLKRAGHSASRVELDIGQDDYTVRKVPIAAQSGSIYGSPSATCAGL
jgi:hypothetical protein